MNIKLPRTGGYVFMWYTGAAFHERSKLRHYFQPFLLIQHHGYFERESHSRREVHRVRTQHHLVH
jgi:hypothetical protein